MIELVVLAGTLAVAGWAAGAQTHRRLAASRALDRYARSRGVVFVPPPLRPRGASPRVVGTKEDVGYVVELFRLGPELRTRISATAQHGHAPVLSVLQRSTFVTRSPVLLAGDDAFDRAYTVTKGDGADRDALRAAMRPLLVLEEKCRGVWLSSDGNRVALSWCGIASDPVVIDAARDAVIEIARWHRPEAPYR